MRRQAVRLTLRPDLYLTLQEFADSSNMSCSRVVENWIIGATTEGMLIAPETAARILALAGRQGREAGEIAAQVLTVGLERCEKEICRPASAPPEAVPAAVPAAVRSVG